MELSLFELSSIEFLSHTYSRFNIDTKRYTSLISFIFISNNIVAKSTNSLRQTVESQDWLASRLVGVTGVSDYAKRKAGEKEEEEEVREKVESSLSV